MVHWVTNWSADTALLVACTLAHNWRQVLLATAPCLGNLVYLTLMHSFRSAASSCGHCTGTVLICQFNYSLFCLIPAGTGTTSACADAALTQPSPGGKQAHLQRLEASNRCTADSDTMMEAVVKVGTGGLD